MSTLARRLDTIESVLADHNARMQQEPSSGAMPMLTYLERAAELLVQGFTAEHILSFEWGKRCDRLAPDDWAWWIDWLGEVKASIDARPDIAANVRRVLEARRLPTIEAWRRGMWPPPRTAAVLGLMQEDDSRA